MLGIAAAIAAGAAFVALPTIVIGLLVLDYLVFALLPRSLFMLFKDSKPASVLVPDSEDPDKGHGPIHRNAAKPDSLLTKAHEGVSTLWENFLLGHKTSPSTNCLAHRQPGDKGTDGKPGKGGPFVWRSYEDVKAAADKFRAGLLQLDLTPLGKEEDGRRLRPLAIFLKNCPEWIISELGLFSLNGCTVPIYETLGEENVAHVLNETACKTVVCKATEAVKVASNAKATPTIKAIILVGEDSDGAAADACKKAKLALHTFEDVLKAGEGKPADPQPPKPEDIATFCYTSGTTGAPKGALLTHANVVATISAVNMVAKISKGDTHLSYLPMAHVFERNVVHCVLGACASLACSQGDPRLIPDDLKTLRPTIFPSVPRLLNRMYDKVLAGAAKSPVKHLLLSAALAHKNKRLSKAEISTHWLWDRILFAPVRKAMGLDNCRMLLSGSAPLAPHVLEFLRCALAPALVMEGYGQTENCAGVTVQTSLTLGDVGPPLQHNEIKLVSVDEMGYKWDDKEHEVRGKTIACEGRGEVWVRGHNVFPGYYKLPEKTEETLTKDGWIQTGDVGLWLTNGALKIIDRKKNMFKLSQGEYVAAEKIEEVYTQAELVNQAFVYGDSYQHNLVVVVTAEPDALAAWAKANKPDLDVNDGEAVSKCKELSEAILKQITTVSKAAKLHGFEIAKAVHVSPEPFSEDNDLLTPTFKLKRPAAKKLFADKIDAMYESLDGSLKHSVKDS